MSRPEVEGKKLDGVLDVDHGFVAYPGVVVPPSDQMTTFEFEMNGQRWLYLDPYGNEDMPPEIQKQLFGNDDLSLAVNLETGVVAMAEFNQDEDGLMLYVHTLDDWHHYYSRRHESKSALLYRMPAEAVRMIEKLLRSKKRPWSLSIRDVSLFGFVTRWEGYSDMVDNLIVSFDFRPEGYLELWGDCYRWVTEWKGEDDD